MFDPAPALDVLERIARGHAPDSEEHRAIDLAARALLYIHAAGQSASFRRYIEEMSEPLSPDQKAFLRTLGLE